ncbi:MAG: helix-turn-helix domain-containing protein [Colwellia sp.]|nr:helix-turn-helix domain-containing protein [Colwellia sp.]
MSQSNKAETKVEKQTSSRYVDCDNCSMQPVCQPIDSGKQSFDLTSNYLTRRIPVTVGYDTAAHLTKKSDIRLFEQAMPLTAIFAVCSGTFKLCKTAEDGSEKVVGFRFPGELIGEDALFLEKYNYSAIALGDNSVCEVFVEQLSACGKLAPEVQQNLIQLLIKQSYLQQNNTQALIGKKSADCLLAAFLLNICSRNAKHSGSETETELSISRHDIASFLGIRRETLSRLLSKFQQQALISLKGKKLTLLSPDTLQHLSNS